MKLYINYKPRTFVITSDSHALVVRHPNPSYKTHHIHLHAQESESTAIIEFLKLDQVDTSHFQCIQDNLLGLLGFFNVKSNIFMGFITQHKKIATPKLGENIYRIDEVGFHCINSDAFDAVTSTSPSSVSKFLSSGDFFYSPDFDITSNVLERGFENTDFKLFADTPYFERFMWNNFLNSDLIEFRNRLSIFEVRLFDRGHFLVTITRGYAKTVNVSIREDNDGLLTIVNKQSCIKDGPLFGDWGCDDKGAVSNFQESEVIIYSKFFCFSYIIVKGNVPCFWETETNKFSKVIKFPRLFEASQHAFRRHMDMLFNEFGDVHIVRSFPTEFSNFKHSLGESLEAHIEEFNKDGDFLLNDTSLKIKSSSIRKNGYSTSNPYDHTQQLIDNIIEYGALLYDLGNSHFIGKQLGVFRITTFNSLSKANFVAKIISQEVIELAFRDLGVPISRDLLIKHAQLWKECDHVITKNIQNFISYTTKLKGSSATSMKKNLKSKVTKKYFNSVIDPKINETALLKLLGRLQDQVPVSLRNPMHDYIRRELEKRAAIFTSTKQIEVFATTFNINGQMYEDSISSWINLDRAYEVVLIGIQEIIELSASKMVNVESTANKKFWESKIQLALNKTDKYLVLWSGQLGGLALFLFVRSGEANKITGVESGLKKTGFGGVTANKGGIALRFNYENTKLCFVTSHLAAGWTNVDERHHDYKVIAKGVKFSKNRRIKDHDGVIWLGDLNFRININYDQALELVNEKQFGKLFEYDQLNLQMAKGESFPFFDEMEITFPPTYKFDNGTTTYDTSEKQRVPAWTDRILYMSKSKIIKPLEYRCVDDLIFSDHRPVVGKFRISIKVENEALKKDLSNELVDVYRQKFGPDFINGALIDDAQGLPPPSTDAEKWWLSGPAKISIPELNGKIINPQMINPFRDPEFSTQ